MFDVFVKAFGTIFLVTGVVFLAIILGTMMGGVAGWVVGLVFNDTMLALKDFLGTDATNFQVGAALGFVGGFFRATVNAKTTAEKK